MKRLKTSVLVGPWQKKILYIASALLWVSGVAWLYLRYFGQIQTEYGLQSSPAQPLWLKIHGAAAMAFLMVFGTFLLQHVPAGWQDNRHRPSGSSLVVFCALLVLSGWGLYYLGDEKLRHMTSFLHSGIGVLFPLIIFLHVWLTNRK
jgi:Kef-type K+ transport system membrane component KefB